MTPRHSITEAATVTLDTGCLRELAGPEGQPCPWCSRPRPSRLDVLVTILVSLALGALLIGGVR